MLTSEQCPWTIFCMVCVAVIVFVQFEIIILAHWGTVSDGEHQTHTLDVGLTHVRKRNTTVLKTMAQYINQSGSAWLKHNYTTSIPTCFDVPPNLGMSYIYAQMHICYYYIISYYIILYHIIGY